MPLDKKGLMRAPRNLFVTFFHQSARRMDRTELIYHWGIEVIIITIISVFFMFFDTRKSLSNLLIIWICIHGLNWLINDHFWEIMIVCFNWVKGSDYEKTSNYIYSFQRRVEKSPFIMFAGIFGSFSRKVWHSRSDLDIFIVREPGLLNGIKACILATYERSIAFFARIPLDLYVGDSTASIDKYYRLDEEAVIIVSKSDKNCCVDRGTITLEDAIKRNARKNKVNA
jgi:predicted nucleotidyltransferase